MRAQEDRDADHEALRGLREAFTEAINARDFNLLQPLLTETLTFTTVDNRKLSGVAEMQSYWQQMFEGENAVLESLIVTPEADAETEFLSEDIGVTHGISRDVFQIKSVGHREMTSRWTAVVRKVNDQWKVERVHMSGNILDNPVLTAQKRLGNLKAAVGLFFGIVIGFITRAFLARRKKTP